MGVEAAGKPQTMTITDNDNSIIYPPPQKKIMDRKYSKTHYGND